MTESTQYNAIRLALAKLGCILFRNNTGLFETSRGTKVRTGLCVGSSDLIGWNRQGRFVAIEVKAPGRKPTTEQAAFLAAVRAAGGISFVAIGPEDSVLKLLEEERDGLRANQPGPAGARPGRGDVVVPGGPAAGP